VDDGALLETKLFGTILLIDAVLKKYQQICKSEAIFTNKTIFF
jgi:hypothetical protein